jgi:hypothetical protein
MPKRGNTDYREGRGQGRRSRGGDLIDEGCRGSEDLRVRYRRC